MHAVFRRLHYNNLIDSATYFRDPVHGHAVEVKMVPQMGLRLLSLLEGLFHPQGEHLRVLALEHQLDPGHPVLGPAQGCV